LAWIYELKPLQNEEFFYALFLIWIFPVLSQRMWKIVAGGFCFCHPFLVCFTSFLNIFVVRLSFLGWKWYIICQYFFYLANQKLLFWHRRMKSKFLSILVDFIYFNITLLIFLRFFSSFALSTCCKLVTLK